MSPFFAPSLVIILSEKPVIMQSITNVLHSLVSHPIISTENYSLASFNPEMIFFI